ncbi:MAG: transglutaminase family protein [Hyphomicrobium sp.]|uniref:transglutaminase family protein n=1 Tax=Hyphomicrobium sp. TaxID=82 RepID=UPI0039E6672E
MARIRIVHSTDYTYRNPVGLTRHRLMVRPDDSHDLRLHSAKLDVDPPPASTFWKHDVFDNSICFLEWPESLRTDRLSIVSSLDLTHHPDGQPLPKYTLDAKSFPFSYSNDDVSDLGHLRTPQPGVATERVQAWVRRIVAEAGCTEALKVVEAITHAIKQEFRYEARHEEGTQTAARTVELGQGTCRDFAVLMMEALRTYGIATRFVTGYLYDDTSGVTRGGGSTHAWCSVYLPGAGWIEYDPTNGLVAGANLIRVGVTREAAQAVPISGGYFGNPDDTIGMDVDVSVSGNPIS